MATKYDYIDVWSVVDYEWYTDYCKRRKLNDRLVAKVILVIDLFLLDNNLREGDVVVCGSLASNLFFDFDTQEEEPEYFRAHTFIKSYGGTKKCKYSDIDLYVKDRPDLLGFHDDYAIKVDVGNFLTGRSVPYQIWKNENRSLS